MTLMDDGAGVPTNTDPAVSAGLRMMRYRADTNGGRLLAGKRLCGAAAVCFRSPVAHL